MSLEALSKSDNLFNQDGKVDGLIDFKKNKKLRSLSEEKGTKQ